MASMKEIFKKAKEKGYDGSYDDFKSDYGNVPEDFDELMGKEIKMYKPQAKKSSDDNKRLAGIKEAKKEGFTHTNPAKVS